VGNGFGEHLASALAYAARGWRVFPLVPRTKRPLTENGFKDATSSEKIIRGWWARYPDAGVAIATGAESGLVVLDCDPAHDGGESLQKLEAERGALPDTPVSLTGGGGTHTLFAHPGQKVSSKVGLPGYPGLDTRADGGYIVAPPSIHPNGRTYVWNVMLHPADVKLAPCPEWLVELANAGGKANGAGANGGKVHEGGRNDYLFRHGCGLRARGRGEAEIREELHRENGRHCEPPLGEHEVETILGSIKRYPAGFAESGAGEPASPTSDWANAIRLGRLARDRLLYCEPLGWLVWRGHRWIADTAAAESTAAGLLGREVAREAVELVSNGGDEAERKRAEALLRWARESEREPRIRAALSLTRSQLAVAPDALDSLPRQLPTPSGIVDLASGQLRAARPEDLVTRCTAVRYDANARSETWDRVLAHALPDPELRDYFGRAIGYAAVGDPREDVLLVIHGPPAASKSTIMGAIAEALGEHAATLGLEDLAERDRSGAARPEVVRLRGRRIALAYETGRRLRLDAALAKLLAGGDRIQARDLYRGPIEFRPSCVVVLVGNHRPRAAADDDALWRRLVEIPFAEPLGEQERDPDVRERLRDPERDLPAVLAWLVSCAREYLAHGLGERPEAVSLATADYREAMDPLAPWLTDRCSLEPGAWTAAARLAASYADFCRVSGDSQIKARAFGAALRRRGCSDEKRGGERGWLGIKVER
jgi:putative DNA primase/helicase